MCFGARGLECKVAGSMLRFADLEWNVQGLVSQQRSRRRHPFDLTAQYLRCWFKGFRETWAACDSEKVGECNEQALPSKHSPRNNKPCMPE